MQQKILIVDDDVSIVETLTLILEQNQYNVSSCDSGNTAIKNANQYQPDLIILDWILPDISGIEVCKTLRADKKTKFIPILMLTAKTMVDDKIIGLETGADDYLMKPCRTDELLAQVKALLRRVEYAVFGKDGMLRNGNIRIYIDKQKVTVKGKEAKLTKKEYNLLYLLMRKPGKVCTKDYLFETVWGWESNSYRRTVDTHIYSLRKKLGKDGNKINTVEGVGYKFGEE